LEESRGGTSQTLEEDEAIWGGVELNQYQVKPGTHVKKNVEACGKFCARVVGMDVGFCENAPMEERIPEERVTIMKEF